MASPISKPIDPEAVLYSTGDLDGDRLRVEQPFGVGEAGAVAYLVTSHDGLWLDAAQLTDLIIVLVKLRGDA